MTTKEMTNMEMKPGAWFFAEWFSIIGSIGVCFVFFFYQHKEQSARHDQLCQQWCQMQKENAQMWIESNERWIQSNQRMDEKWAECQRQWVDTQKEIKQLYIERR